MARSRKERPYTLLEETVPTGILKDEVYPGMPFTRNTVWRMSSSPILRGIRRNSWTPRADSHAELLHALMLADSDRADRIGELWVDRRAAPSLSS